MSVIDELYSMIVYTKTSSAHAKFLLYKRIEKCCFASLYGQTKLAVLFVTIHIVGGWKSMYSWTVNLVLC